MSCPICKGEHPTSVCDCQGQVQPIVICTPPIHGRRVETGPVQFGDDYPGIFIRGDQAFHFACNIAFLLGSIERGKTPSEIEKSIVRNLGELLRECDLNSR